MVLEWLSSTSISITKPFTFRRRFEVTEDERIIADLYEQIKAYKMQLKESRARTSMDWVTLKNLQRKVSKLSIELQDARDMLLSERSLRDGDCAADCSELIELKTENIFLKSHIRKLHRQIDQLCRYSSSVSANINSFRKHEHLEENAESADGHLSPTDFSSYPTSQPNQFCSSLNSNNPMIGESVKHSEELPAVDLVSTSCKYVQNNNEKETPKKTSSPVGRIPLSEVQTDNFNSYQPFTTDIVPR